MSAYEKIKKIYDETRLEMFVMAATHLMDIGWQVASKITDTDIEEAEGNGLMTKEFVQALLKISRKIAQTCNPVEFIQFCQVEKLYDTRYFKPRKRG